MKTICATMLLVSGLASASTQYVPSGRAKAFKGPEGEVITIVPLNHNTKLLIYAHNTYGPAAEKALVYDYRDDTLNPHAGFVPPTGASAEIKKDRQIVVLNKAKDQWVYSDVLESNKVTQIKLNYSEELSSKIKVNDLVIQAKEYKFEPDTPL